MQPLSTPIRKPKASIPTLKAKDYTTEPRIEQQYYSPENYNTSPPPYQFTNYHSIANENLYDLLLREF